MPQRKKDLTYAQDDKLDAVSSTEDDLEDQDDDYEEPEDYFVSDGKKIQKMKRHDKRNREED